MDALKDITGIVGDGLLDASSSVIAHFASVLAIVGLLLVLQQLRQARLVSQADLLTRVIYSLQEPEMRNHRDQLRRVEHKHCRDWPDEARFAAGMVCQSFEVAGMLAYDGLILADVLVSSWPTPIMRLFAAAYPYVLYRRVEAGNDRFCSTSSGSHTKLPNHRSHGFLAAWDSHTRMPTCADHLPGHGGNGCGRSSCVSNAGAGLGCSGGRQRRPPSTGSSRRWMMMPATGVTLCG